MLDESGDEPDRAEQVGRHNGLGRGQEGLRLVPVLDTHDSGHRDEDVEAGMLREHFLRGGLDARGVGGVDLHGVDAGVLRGDLLQQFGASAADNDGVTPGS